MEETGGGGGGGGRIEVFPEKILPKCNLCMLLELNSGMI